MASRETVFKLEGLSELNKQLHRLDAVTQGKALDVALEAGGEVIRAEAARLTPRSEDSGGTTGRGHGADHIVQRIESKSNTDRESSIGPESPFWYLIFPELGTPNQPAVGMLRRAADTRFKEATTVFRDVLAAEIKAVTK